MVMDFRKAFKKLKRTSKLLIYFWLKSTEGEGASTFLYLTEDFKLINLISFNLKFILIISAWPGEQNSPEAKGKYRTRAQNWCSGDIKMPTRTLFNIGAMHN